MDSSLLFLYYWWLTQTRLTCICITTQDHNGPAASLSWVQLRGQTSLAGKSHDGDSRTHGKEIHECGSTAKKDCWVWDALDLTEPASHLPPQLPAAAHVAWPWQGQSDKVQPVNAVAGPLWKEAGWATELGNWAGAAYLEWSWPLASLPKTQLGGRMLELLELVLCFLKTFAASR